MARLKLGGMSISEGHSRLHVTCTNAANALSDVCSSLGANRINITLLTHLAEGGRETCGTAPCLESSDGFFGSFLLKRGQGAIETVTMQGDLCILSIFPHDRRPGITGALLELLARLEVYPLGLASSPSSISVLIPLENVEKVVFGLFDTFEFPPTKSPSDWSADCRGKEGLLREIRCSYEERVIKVCNFSRQSELDFWSVTLPQTQIGPLGSVLTSLGGLVMGLFFTMAQAEPDGCLRFAFCLASARGEEVREALTGQLPGADVRRHRPVTAIYLQGPHFGDRHGITSVLSAALRSACVVPLAVSCAISSITLIVPGDEVDRAVTSLKANFEVPS